MTSSLRAEATALAPRLVAWRRELHRHPELGFEEHRTAAFVAERLRELDIPTRVGVAATGVVATLGPETPRRRAILLRADMDALPIQEVEGREYGSEVPGRMHACGHDGHTAILLGAATLLAGRRQELDRRVVFCFQPAEEGRGGAQRMIAEGVLDLEDVEAAFGLHLWSPFPVGTLHLRSGPLMAAQDEFSFRIHGVGGHGALPHEARDPLYAAAQVVTALQTVVSRAVDPVEPAVVALGALHAGEAGNVVPAHAEGHGSLRSFDPGVRERLRRRVRELVEGVAAACGCRGEVEIRPGYPAVLNEEGAVGRARAAALDVFGPEAVHDCAPILAAEDFAYFACERPAAFVFVGAGNSARGIDAPHHSPRFDIDEDALPLGAEYFARLALGAA